VHQDASVRRRNLLEVTKATELMAISTPAAALKARYAIKCHGLLEDAVDMEEAHAFIDAPCSLRAAPPR